MYTILQAGQAATIWNCAFPDDQTTDGDALDLMNGPEPADTQKKHKRDVFLLAAATIAGAIAIAMGGTP